MRSLLRLHHLFVALLLLHSITCYHAFITTRHAPRALSPIIIIFATNDADNDNNAESDFFVEFPFNTPNPDAVIGVSDYYDSLKSSYPDGTPAGLRGEAIRSALTTTERCLCWKVDSGVLKISGKGTPSFLHNKLTADFVENCSIMDGESFQEACLLDAKGRLVDVLGVSSSMKEEEEAYILPSSDSFTSADLLKRLDPFVFPLDQVELQSYDDSTTSNNAFSFSLASTQFEHARNVISELQEKLPLPASSMVFPPMHQSAVWKVNESLQILVVPSVGLPSVACVGYTFVFLGSAEALKLGKSVYQHLISDDNAEGPIEVGPRELETMRVQAGQPGFGHEFGMSSNHEIMIKTSPLELHLKSTIDLDKGCYLGQEGIASMLKNARGPPRLLYSVIFQDDFNCYEAQSRGDDSELDNLTVLPQPGQKLYALGSNEELMVGTITSMGEAGGTGNPDTVALALVKRADSVQKQMKALGLEISRNDDEFSDTNIMSGSGMLQPPPMDSLDGLEVIVEGTFTVGVLKSIPSRRFRRDANMFLDLIQVQELEDKPKKMVVQQDETPNLDESDSVEDIEAAAAKAAEEAEQAAQEAKRKAEKMEILKKRAEEAMARRKQKK